jgi:hypothetical protein
LSTADWNQDGKDDLFISAIWNKNKAGVEQRGQVIALLAPGHEPEPLPAMNPNITAGSSSKTFSPTPTMRLCVGECQSMLVSTHCWWEARGTMWVM